MAISSDIEKLERRWMDNPTGLMFAPLAEAYRKAGNFSRALEILEAGLGQHPEYVPALIVRGRCHLDAAALTAAEAAFEQALERDPVNAIALRGIAEVHERTGQIGLAIERLQFLLEVERGDPEARHALERLRVLRETHGDRIAPLGEEAASPASGVLADLPWGTVEERPLAEAAPPLDYGAAPSEPETVEMPGPPEDAHPEPEPIEAIEPSGETPEGPEPVPATEPHGGAWAEPWSLRDEEPEEAGGAAAAADDLAALDVGAGHETAGDAPVDRSAAAEIVNESVGAAEDLAEAAESRMDRPDDRPETAGFSETWAMWAAWETRTEPPSEASPSAVEERHAAAAPPSPEPPREVVEEPVAEAAGEATEADQTEPPEPDRAEPAYPEWAEPPARAAAVPFEEDELSPFEESVAPPPVERPLPLSGEPLPTWKEETAVASGDRLPPEEAHVPEGAVEEEPELIVTASMAELFLKQGHRDLALAVYRQLAERAPEDGSLRAAIAELEREAAERSAPAHPAPRFAACDTGGESVGSFLRRVLEAPPPAVISSVLPPAIEPPGEPTRPAGEPLALSAVFGSAPVAPPTIPGREVSPVPAARDPDSEPSYDEFFESPSPVEPEPIGQGPDARPSDAEDLRQFNEWLKGLKR